MWGEQASLDLFVIETLRKMQNSMKARAVPSSMYTDSQDVLFTTIRNQIVVMYICREKCVDAVCITGII